MGGAGGGAEDDEEVGGIGVTAETPEGYVNRGQYPAGLNEQNCPNYPFCFYSP